MKAIGRKRIRVRVGQRGKVVAFFIAWLILEEALVAGGAPDSRKGVEQVMALNVPKGVTILR